MSAIRSAGKSCFARAVKPYDAIASLVSLLPWASRSPSPQPSPQGEGAHFDRVGKITERSFETNAGTYSPSPWGEGWGEGDRRVQTGMGVRLHRYG